MLFPTVPCRHAVRSVTIYEHYRNAFADIGAEILQIYCNSCVRALAAGWEREDVYTAEYV